MARAPIAALTARYNEHLQSRTTLGPKISRQKICGLLNFLPRGISLRPAVLPQFTPQLTTRVSGTSWHRVAYLVDEFSLKKLDWLEREQMVKEQSVWVSQTCQYTPARQDARLHERPAFTSFILSFN